MVDVFGFMSQRVSHYSTWPLQYKHSHRQYINIWGSGWSVFQETLFIKTDRGTFSSGASSVRPLFSLA